MRVMEGAHTLAYGVSLLVSPSSCLDLALALRGVS